MLKKILKNCLLKNEKISRLLYNLREELQVDTKIETTPWGFKMSGNGEMKSGKFEPKETEFILKLLKEVDIFINIGANIGYYCLHALSLNKYVIAIEPNTKNIKKLLDNILINRFEDRVEVHHTALGDKVGVQSMWGGGTGASLRKGWAGNPESLKYLVPVNTLDNIVSGRFENKKILILMDVEGYEYEVLKGSRRTCSEVKALEWVIEITTTQNQPVNQNFNAHFKKTFDQLYQYGYKSFIVDDHLKQINENEVSDISFKKIAFQYHNFYFKND